MKKYIPFIAFLLLTATLPAQTPQKVGHFNLGNFLTSLPEVKEVDSLLQKYQATLLDTMNQMNAKLQADFEAYQKNINNLTPVQAKEKEDQLRKADEALRNYSQKADAMLAQKRNELLSPILAKLDKVIKEVGKEGKYALILDESMMNALLFADKAFDVSAIVEQKYKQLK